MRKNRMMRAASALLVAVLMTTCTISGTFAKYVTSETATDSARVAKWGVVITANGKTFAEAYDTNDSEAATVVSSNWDAALDENEDNVIAPGTKGDMASMTLSGTPEVALRISYVGDFDVSSNWIVDGDFYCPLVITINGVTGTSINGIYYHNEAEFEAAVEKAIAKYSKDYAAGTDLSGVTGDSLDISWQWPFSTSDANDKKDTKLGDKAVAEDITISLAVTTTATQID